MAAPTRNPGGAGKAEIKTGAEAPVCIGLQIPGENPT